MSAKSEDCFKAVTPAISRIGESCSLCSKRNRGPGVRVTTMNPSLIFYYCNACIDRLAKAKAKTP